MFLQSLCWVTFTLREKGDKKKEMQYDLADERMHKLTWRWVS